MYVAHRSSFSTATRNNGYFCMIPNCAAMAVLKILKLLVLIGALVVADTVSVI